MQDYPQQQGIDQILRNAFFYWKKTWMYQFMVGALYFSVLMLVFIYFASKFGLLDQFISISQQHGNDIKKMQTALFELTKNPNYATLSLIIIGTKVFLYPLEVGLLKIYRKIDLKEEYSVPDLLSGYSGANFFIYAGYYMFWYTIFTYSIPTLVLPLVWILITLFVTPLMFFKNIRVFEGISLSIKALKSNFILILVGFLVALIFKTAGFLFFFFGYLVTYPFMTAMVYSMYQALFKEDELG